MKHDITSALTHGWPGAQWVVTGEVLTWLSADRPEPTMEEIQAHVDILNAGEALRLLREKRNSLLKGSDMYVLPDFPHSTEEKRVEWLAYRQALRDLPTNANPLLNSDTYELELTSVTWPIPPS